MTVWAWILLACVAAYALKLSGYLVPDRVLQQPAMTRLTMVLTVGLLAALVVTNTFAHGQGLVLDARLVALGVAALALWVRAPFLLVVVLGALAAAITRLLGWG
ncbi:AzlD domain-containing protein [Raineyella fluvialis]|uniref:AzlD domain-containing protein n=1 Tax=Raineyella fluvialis TaxID=2662261 RepID=A0A5Q2FJB6_9ACTN|nr:AzlD domain-containing protein [Raineyella fluvialis]QGF24755.1 AzlD domain-containing protein [Raineyella fluvialis]